MKGSGAAFPAVRPRKKKYTVGDVLIFIALTLLALLIFTPFKVYIFQLYSWQKNIYS